MKIEKMRKPFLEKNVLYETELTAYLYVA